MFNLLQVFDGVTSVTALLFVVPATVDADGEQFTQGFRITSQTYCPSEQVYTAAGGCAREKMASRIGRFAVRLMMEIPLVLYRISLDIRLFYDSIAFGE